MLYVYTPPLAGRRGVAPAAAKRANRVRGERGLCMADPIKWDNGGPRDCVHWVPTVRVDPGETVKGVSVSESVCGVWLHWVGGRTVPCLDAAGECPYHTGGDDCGLRWKGYFGIVRGRGSRVEYAAVTEEGWRLCPLFRELSDAGDLRGVEVALSRIRGGPRRPVRISLPEGEGKVSWWKSLPAPPDVRAAVGVLLRRRGPSGPAPEKGR